MILLSPREREVLAFVESCVERDGAPPTVNEIAAHLSVRSSFTVMGILAGLERKGRITRTGLPRGIRLVSRRDRFGELRAGLQKLLTTRGLDVYDLREGIAALLEGAAKP